MNNNTAEKLAKYGLTGVSIALIILLGFTFKLFYEFATNHVGDLMNVVQKSTEVNERLIGSVNNSNETQKEIKTLLQDYLRK